MEYLTPGRRLRNIEAWLQGLGVTTGLRVYSANVRDNLYLEQVHDVERKLRIAAIVSFRAVGCLCLQTDRTCCSATKAGSSALINQLGASSSGSSGSLSVPLIAAGVTSSVRLSRGASV